MEYIGSLTLLDKKEVMDMEMREIRREENVLQSGGTPEGRVGGESLVNLHSAAQEFLAAGDNAIKNALATGNSEAFLEANRQEGGQ